MFVGPRLQMQYNTHFCSACFWGHQSDGCQAKFSGHKRRQIPGNSCPQEIKDSQQITRKQIQESQFKHLIVKKCFLPANLNLDRKSNVKLYLPLWTRYDRQKSRRADFGKNSYPVPTSASFPRMLAVGSGAGAVSQRVPASYALSQSHLNNFQNLCEM